MKANLRTKTARSSIKREVLVGFKVTNFRDKWRFSTANGSEFEFEWKVPPSVVGKLFTVRLNVPKPEIPQFLVPQEIVDWFSEAVILPIGGYWDVKLTNPIRLAMVAALQAPNVEIQANARVPLPELRLAVRMVVRQNEPTVNWKIDLYQGAVRKNLGRRSEGDFRMIYSSVKFEHALRSSLRSSSIELKLPREISHGVKIWLESIQRYDGRTISDLLGSVKGLMQTLYSQVAVFRDKVDSIRPLEGDPDPAIRIQLGDYFVRIIRSRKWVIQLMLGNQQVGKQTFLPDEITNAEWDFVFEFLSGKLVDFEPFIDSIVEGMVSLE